MCPKLTVPRVVLFKSVSEKHQNFITEPTPKKLSILLHPQEHVYCITMGIKFYHLYTYSLPPHLTPLCSTITHHNEQTQTLLPNKKNLCIALSSLLILYLVIKKQPFLKLIYALNLCFCVLGFCIAFMYHFCI